MNLRLVPTDDQTHRIGEPGVVWATRIAGDQWNVYGYLSGLLAKKVTRAQAERLIENFQQSASHHPSKGANA